MNKESDSDASIAGPSGAVFISSDIETDSSSENLINVPSTKKVKRRRKRQAFRQAWLKDPAFKSWLEQVQDDPYRGKCTICCKYIKAIKSNLRHHGNSSEHIMNRDYGRDPLATTATDSSSDSVILAPAAKKAKRQRPAFRLAWLEDPAFKSWLQRVQDDPYRGKCTICCKYITASKIMLEHHANSKRHIRNMKSGKGSLVSKGEATRNFSDEVKVAETRVCIDAVEHNRSFRSFVPFMRMLQKALPDPNLVKSMSLNPKKMTAITNNVINKSIITKTMENLQGKCFSILIDETKDISGANIVCFLIRYVHERQIRTDLLDLIRIKACTAENLYRCFRYSLKKYNLPISNMLGVCADNGNVTARARNSFASRLAADNAEICVWPWICHSMQLAARQACECLPQHVEKFLHSLYADFSQSPKRLSMLEGTQQFMTIAKRKVLQPSATRWLALTECVTRVLDQWTVLFSVLAEASTEKDSDVAKRIFSSFNCLFTKAYLQFMEYFLRTFTELNGLFESSRVLVYRMLPDCYRVLNVLGGNFIQSKHLCDPNIYKIDINNQDNLLPLTTIFPGTACMITLSQITDGNPDVNEQILQFYRNVQNCYKSGYKSIVDRVPFDDAFLNALHFLHPEVALDSDKHEDGQLNCILSKFKSKFDPDVVADEWFRLPFTFTQERKVKLEVMSFPEFWYEMSIAVNVEDECILPNISKLAQLCLSLPYSNADVELYFSTVAEMNTRDKNRLNLETIAAITRIKLDMKDKNAHWHDYKITDDMLNLFDNSMYENEKIPKELIGILLPDDMNESTSDSDSN